MRTIVFLKCELSQYQVVFDAKEQYKATKKPKEWLVKGMSRNTDSKGIYHLKNRDFLVPWHHCSNGYFFAYVWCEKSKLNSGKKKCIEELKKQIPKMKKIITEKQKDLILYKNSVENFALKMLRY